MNNHAGSTLTRPTGTTVFTYKRLIKLPQGEGCVWYLRPYNYITEPSVEGISIFCTSVCGATRMGVTSVVVFKLAASIRASFCYLFCQVHVMCCIMFGKSLYPENTCTNFY